MVPDRGILRLGVSARRYSALRASSRLGLVRTPVRTKGQRQVREIRVLGVDPGLTRCGLGVIDGRPGGTPRLVIVDVVRTDPGQPVGHRLMAIEDAVKEWLRRHRPDVLAVERVFSQHNVRTVMATAQASAVAITAAARAGIPVALHTPSEVKAAVTGNGRADKAQVASMVKRLLGLDAVPRPADAADALALAICHIWRAPLAALTARAGTAAQPTVGAR
jgi:crossover junction endodeoxyribonuclease RuvC